MKKDRSKFDFFFLPSLLSNYFSRPKTYITRKQFFSTWWGKVFEVPFVGLLWLFSKIPIIGTRIEHTFAQKLTKKWFFKAIPNLDGLSKSALDYKQEKILEINKKIDVQTKILDITTFNEIIDTFPFGVVSECGCRSVIMHCDALTHTCLIMRWAQDVSEKLEDHSKYQLATREELERVVDSCDKYALVHMTLHHPADHVYVICNCCDCCCPSFREFLVHAVPLIVGSKYVAKIDPKKCNGCFYCVNFRCRFRAIQKVNEDGTVIDPKKEDKERFKIKWPIWSERRNSWGRRIRKDPPSWKKVKAEHSEKWYAKVDPNRCFGCGNCASPKYGCPQGAIKLYPRV